jgi:uncharacterized membrane protein YgcG
MSESVLSQAPFLPPQPPKGAILDFSGVLSAGDRASLETQAHAQVGLKTKVVILPKDFTTTDLDALGKGLAQQWHVGGERMLMLVDLKDHKVRVYVGKELQSHGLTGTLLREDIIPNQFIPYMKQHDLAGAIQNTMAAAQQKVYETRSTTTAPSQTYSQVPSTGQPYASAPAAQDSFGGFWLGAIAIMAAIGIAMFAFSFKNRKKENVKLANEFKEKIGPLYEKADQIGSASEYLPTEQNPELAQRVALFFNKLTTLEKAVSEISTLEKRNQVWQVRDGYMKLMRSAEVLDGEADQLKKDVNALTGGVQTMPDLPKQPPIDATAYGERDKHKVTIPERFQQEMQYRRPEWTYQPAYYQPMGGGMSSLMMLGMMLNQWDMNRRFDMLSSQIQHGGGGGWNQQWDDQQQAQQSNFDPGWGDSSSGGGFSDAGGDWGGGGADFGGGGGDFGGGGGDW